MLQSTPSQTHDPEEMGFEVMPVRHPTTLRAVWLACDSSSVLVNQLTGREKTALSLADRSQAKARLLPIQAAFVSAVEERMGMPIHEMGLDDIEAELDIAIMDAAEDLLDGRGLVVWKAVCGPRTRSNISIATWHFAYSAITNASAVTVAHLTDNPTIFEVSVASRHANKMMVNVTKGGFLPSMALVDGDEEVAFAAASQQVPDARNDNGEFSEQFTTAYNAALSDRYAQRALLDVVRGKVLEAYSKIERAIPVSSVSVPGDGSGRPKRPPIGGGISARALAPESGPQS